MKCYTSKNSVRNIRSIYYKLNQNFEKTKWEYTETKLLIDKSIKPNPKQDTFFGPALYKKVIGLFNDGKKYKNKNLD